MREGTEESVKGVKGRGREEEKGEEKEEQRKVEREVELEWKIKGMEWNGGRGKQG